MIAARQQLRPAEVAEVLALAADAAAADGVGPLAEQTLLRLRHRGDPPVTHLLARDDGGRLGGYAQVDTAEGGGPIAEVVVHPSRRGRGLGRALVVAAHEVAGRADPGGRLRVWAHGDLPAAAALADSLGLTRTRVLWRIRRSLAEPIGEPELAGGVTIRPFRPGADEEAWLAVNARAFADHPEQGRWTMADLRVRMAEPWFDPAGFLLAERGGTLLGFHWTKVHPTGAVLPDRPLGEVYVLGVDPAGTGLRLGTALALAGLRHLRDRGLDTVMLYVDDDNPAAVALYTKLGFTRWSADVTYTWPGSGD
jgi:mycothiol synthase